MIIPGPKSVTGDHMDTYLQPLVDELNILWDTGVRTHDADRYNDEATFTLHAILLWTTHDLPAYGCVAGCVTKGYRGCPICGHGTISRRSAALKKNVYDKQHRRWLPPEHPYRLGIVGGYAGPPEHRGPPPMRTAADVLQWGHLREEFLRAGGTPKSADPAQIYGIKRVPSLYQLPYWKVSFHNLI